MNTLFAQVEKDSLFHTVAKRLHEFQYNVPREKVYVHQDRMQYIAGETIWFKVYQSSSPDYPVMSGVVYVELIDGMNQMVAETKWKLENGSAAGHILLSDTLTSGLYQLRAYTGWMQNFDAEGFFTRELTIASLYAASQESETVVVEANKVLSEDLPAAESPERKVELTFFPEGGNLVAGLPSKIAFKVNDRQGRGIKASGVIRDQDGNEVRRFETQHQGMGTFYLVPEAGKQYIARLNEVNVRTALPEAYVQGVVMSLRYRPDGLRITLRHNLDAVRTQTPFYLTIHQEGIPWFNAHVILKEEMTVFDIPKEKLPTGMFVITIYDESLHAYTERLAFVNYPQRLEIQARTDKTHYGSRQKVRVEIEVLELADDPQTGDFSVAVVKASLDDVCGRNNLFTDHFLTSELRGRIEQPTYYFQSDCLVAHHLDLLLMTHGWRRYVWEDKVSGELPEMAFPIEQGLNFSGRVLPLTQDGKVGIMDITASFRHDSIGDFLSFQSAEDGSFWVSNYHFEDTAEVILSAQDSKRRTHGIVMMENYRTPSTYYNHEMDMAEEEDEELLVEWKGVMPQGGIRDIDKITHELPDIQVTARRKKPTDPRVRHNEEMSLSTYQVKRFSYSIPGGNGKGNQGALAILSFVPKMRLLQKLGGETYFLDGVRISKDALSGISPFFIDRVELLTPAQAMIYGAVQGGAVMFWTKGWEDMVYSQPVKTVSYKFAGYNQPKEFYAPDYIYYNDVGKADHRNTLYWQPHVTINAKGKAEFSFFTSDDKGEYVIHCEGKNANGKKGMESVFFTIN